MTLNQARALLDKINYDHKWTVAALREAAGTLSPEDRARLPEALRITGEAYKAEADELRHELRNRARRRIGLRVV